jgi:hypothetical protein
VGAEEAVALAVGAALVGPIAQGVDEHLWIAVTRGGAGGVGGIRRVRGSGCIGCVGGAG